jgi:N utilization substance protein A
MANLELIRSIEQLSRDKDIDKDVLFDALETAMLSALRKKYAHTGDVVCSIDRDSGDLEAQVEGVSVRPEDLGRIAAQVAKQVIIQKIRESERDAIYSDFESRMGEIVTGHLQRFEGPNIIVNLGRTEAVLPRSEQARDEHYKVGDRIRAYVTDVKKVGQKVRIILSRTNPNLVRRLFELEVPEINEKIIEIVTLVREPGYRSKVAVSSYDPKVDCVGACVGVRGARIKSIIDELGGEKIDIIRWNESSEVLIKNALKPAEVAEISLDRANRKAWVLVEDDQLSLAIGKRGQNVRLASKLVGWDIDIITRSQERERATRAIAEFGSLEGVNQELARRLYMTGFFSLDDLCYRGPEALQHVDEMGEERASAIIQSARALLERRSRGEGDDEAAATDGTATAEEATPDSEASIAEETTTAGEAHVTETPPAGPTPTTETEEVPGASIEEQPQDDQPKEGAGPEEVPPAPAVGDSASAGS